MDKERNGVEEESNGRPRVWPRGKERGTRGRGVGREREGEGEGRCIVCRQPIHRTRSYDTPSSSKLRTRMTLRSPPGARTENHLSCFPSSRMLPLSRSLQQQLIGQLQQHTRAEREGASVAIGRWRWEPCEREAGRHAPECPYPRAAHLLKKAGDGLIPVRRLPQRRQKCPPAGGVSSIACKGELTLRPPRPKMALFVSVQSAVLHDVETVACRKTQIQLS